jgi:hypothetical protein
MHNEFIQSVKAQIDQLKSPEVAASSQRYFKHSIGQSRRMYGCAGQPLNAYRLLLTAAPPLPKTICFAGCANLP